MSTCKICGEEFVPKRRDSKFCPKDHYRPCKQCGEDFLVKKVGSPPEFCSSSCSAKHRSSNAIKKICRLCGDEFNATNNNSRYCDKSHHKNCLTCGEVFIIANPSKVKDYCSHSCSVKSPKEEKTCKRCGEPYVPTSTRSEYCGRDHFSDCEGCGKSIHLKSPKRVTRFCSLSCSSKSRSYVLTCKSCGKEFSSKKADAKYCGEPHSLSCEVCGNEFSFTYKPYPSSYIGRACSPKCTVAITDYQERNAKGRSTLLDRYGVTNAFLLPGGSSSSPKRVSKLNLLWKERLEKELSVNLALEEKFGDYYADLGAGTILVDINPTVSHNSSVSFPHLIKRCVEESCSTPGHQARKSDYHHTRFLEAEDAGKTLLQYFEWMDEDIFASVVRSKLHLDENKAPARKCEVRKITQKEANSFLRDNHLLGSAKGQSFCVGLFFEGELVFVNTYGAARLNKSYEWEAIRSCSKMNWHVQGGVRRADAFFMREAEPESIVSYVDLALGGGVTEAANPGWELVSTNKPSATWMFVGSSADLDGKPMFVRDASARRLSADRLLGLTVGSKYPSHHSDGTVLTNSDVLLSEGYLKVFDAGTRTFGWRRQHTTG